MFSLLLIISACGNFSSDTERVRINITVNPSNAGTVLTSGGDEIGNEVNYLAVPNAGWEFAGWSGNIESFDNPLNFVLETDVNLTANFSIFRNDYKYQLTLGDEQNSVEMRIGQVPGATDFFDSGTDLESPPPPPGNTLHAWFENGDRNLLWDYRNSFSPETVWEIQVTGGQSGNLDLSWTREIESFSGSLILTDEERTFQTDMASTDTQSITSLQAETLRIIYRFEE